MSIQGSPEWFAERCGLATASRFKDVLAKTKSGPAATRKNYAAQLVCERLTGVPAESYSNAAMQWGTDHEPEARSAYDVHSGEIVESVGFIRHASLQTGASPDGLIGTDGGLEIKCPNTAQHIDALLNGMDPGHIPQIQGAMWITGRKYWNFISYDPRMPERLRLYIQRIERDEAYIAELSKELILFLAEVNITVKRLEELNK